MDEDGSLRRYGLHPVGSDLDEVRELLAAEAAHERRRQGDGDTTLMKLCCVQLFNAGFLTDVLLIWEAKESGWDAHRSIDVQLLCGAGLEETEAYLMTKIPQRPPKRWGICAGSVENQSQWYSRYYTG